MINCLNDFELNEKIKSLAGDERKPTQTILEHIAEVDRRKLFLGLGYDSLFSYLTREVGYSEGSAQRRLDAARLLQKIPEVPEKISQGHLNLGQITKMQKLLRRVKKGTGTSLDLPAQKSILQKLENKNTFQTDLTLAREFGVEVKRETRRLIQKDESVRVELTFSKDEMALIELARQILSHKTGGDLKETIVETARRIVQQQGSKGIREKKTPSSGSLTATVAVIPGTPAPTLKERVPKNATPQRRRAVLNRNNSCQCRDEKTGRICGSKYFLEVDHIRPQWVGGSHHPKNLRPLCKNHNLYRYQADLTS